MKILIFSDIHADWRALERLMSQDADLYICAGDLTNFGRKIDEAGEVMKSRAGRVKVLPGNHETDQQVAQFCTKFGFDNIHSRTFEFAGQRVAGLGYSNPTPFETPGEYSEEEIARRLAEFDALKPTLLVCHCPPFQTGLDRMRNFRHAGSTAVREYLERRQPEYFFCGHIHEAAGVAEKLGETKGMNVGKQGYLLDLTPELIKIQYPGQ